jgi:hypothetical protein
VLPGVEPPIGGSELMALPLRSVLASSLARQRLLRRACSCHTLVHYEWQQQCRSRVFLLLSPVHACIIISSPRISPGIGSGVLETTDACPGRCRRASPLPNSRVAVCTPRRHAFHPVLD